MVKKNTILLIGLLLVFFSYSVNIQIEVDKGNIPVKYFPYSTQQQILASENDSSNESDSPDENSSNDETTSISDTIANIKESMTIEEYLDSVYLSVSRLERASGSKDSCNQSNTDCKKFGKFLAGAMIESSEGIDTTNLNSLDMPGVVMPNGNVEYTYTSPHTGNIYTTYYDPTLGDSAQQMYENIALAPEEDDTPTIPPRTRA